MWRAEDPQGHESAKIIWEIPRYTRGRGLDVGCGRAKAMPHFIGVDNHADRVLFNIDTRPDIVADADDLSVFGSASMDFVFSSHTLEHVKNDRKALAEWWRVIRPGGHLVLYLPHKLFYPNIGTPGANPDHKRDYLPQDVVDMMLEIGSWDLVRNEDRSGDQDTPQGRIGEYSFFQVYKKRTDGKHTYPYQTPRPVKMCAVVRYGGLGDMIQASSIMPGLKAQGYHVTLYTTPAGWEVLKHDPHIDEVYLQDPEQIPNHHLTNFWEWEAKKYDKWVNLSESVEGTLLALPGRANFSWSHQVRHATMNRNYFEFVHQLADVPMPPQPRFYPTEAEKKWAVLERARIGGDMLVMYALAGSSVHKIWPHMDELFARILVTYPGARILTVGDERSTMLEAPWRNEPRVIRRAGKYTSRESFSLLNQVDIVIGPETGMLNGAGHMPMGKIIFMSHSSQENLTRHWVNTFALEPPDLPCFPCHRMHYGRTHCNCDEAHNLARCAVDITADEAWEAFRMLARRVTVARHEREAA